MESHASSYLTWISILALQLLQSNKKAESKETKSEKLMQRGNPKRDGMIPADHQFRDSVALGNVYIPQAIQNIAKDLMENRTYQFFILTFTTREEYKPFLSIFFVLVYLIGVLANSATITVVYRDRHLHTPMYLFLCNLSIVDIFYTSSSVPKLVHMLLTGDYTLSFTQCFVQMFFFSFVVTTEDLLLFIMAYDRYVAICNPLRYHSLLCKKNCILLIVVIWVIGFLNSLSLTVTTSKTSLCYSNTVTQFFCEFKAFAKISCPNAGFQLFTYMEAVIFGFGPFLCSIMSYIKVIIVILHIKSSEGRKKAFSTCSSHLIVLTMFYGTWMSVYIMPPLKDPRVFELTLSILYSTITPMLNPLIFSVRNKDIKRALLKMVGCKVRGE
ncbi:olfactory receptor 5V1-like [Leptodactylus fuscus]|uniref:olfactory receptor 5V1-like n=1 Tax=Leptodactylus fuscus TaxID=238119 RepID=UPI003F4E9567